MNFLREINFFRDWKNLYQSDKLLCLCALSLPILLPLFLFSSTNVIRDIFYVSLPFYTILLFRDRQVVWSLIKDNWFLWGSIAVFLLYMMASVFWSDISEHGRYFQKSKLGIFIFIGTLSTSYLVYRCKCLIPSLAISYIAVAIITGFILLVLYAINVFEIDAWPRLSGLGRATNPIQVGILYALAILMVFFTKLPERLSGMYWRVGLCVIPFTIILLTQSRGPFLSLCLTIPAMILSRSDRNFVQKAKQILVIAVVGIVCAFGVHAVLKNSELIERKTTGRTEIWASAMDHVWEKPIIGHGLANEIIYTHTFDNGAQEYVRNAHSLYLSTLVQGGVIGFLLFLGMIASVLAKAYRANKPHVRDVWPVSFLLFGLIQGGVDFGGYVINLSTEWLVFWWPIGCVVGQLMLADQERLEKDIV